MNRKALLLHKEYWKHIQEGRDDKKKDRKKAKEREKGSGKARGEESGLPSMAKILSISMIFLLPSAGRRMSLIPRPNAITTVLPDMSGEKWAKRGKGEVGELRVVESKGKRGELIVIKVKVRGGNVPLLSMPCSSPSNRRP